MLLLSPFSDFINATLIFQVPIAGSTVSASGNMIPKSEEFCVEAFVSLLSTKAEKNRPDMAGEGSTAYEGYAVNPMLFHPAIRPGMPAKAVISGMEGLFVLDNSVINPPYGREGMGATLEQETGTRFMGWFRLGG